MNDLTQYQYLRGIQPVTAGDAQCIAELNTYQNVVFFPLKIKIELPTNQFLKYFDEKKMDIVTFHTKGLWKGIKPISGPHIKSPSYKIDHEFNELFPYFIQQVQDLLPLKAIHMLQFWEQNVQINEHQDGGASDNDYLFPCSYRIMVIGGEEKSFYIKPFLTENVMPYVKDQPVVKPVCQTEPLFIKLPADSNIFCFNNSACKHGAIMPKGRKVIGFIDAEIDFNRHLQLLKTSLKEYHSYVITKS